jgi:hypothetical protein
VGFVGCVCKIRNAYISVRKLEGNRSLGKQRGRLRRRGGIIKLDLI